MNTQPEALRLADVYPYLEGGERSRWIMDAAAELRRLHALNAELLEALNLVQVDCQYLHHEKKDRHLLSEPCPVEARIRAAIAKAEGEQA